jgi:uncharacterized membrane protein YkvA (DUF1232 family)
MDDVKIGEILLPGSVEHQERRRERVRKSFWPVLKKAFVRIPFSRDVVAAYYCAMDVKTPTRVRGILLAALAYFVMPVDMIPDFVAVFGFSDDIAVLSAAIAAVRSHLNESHYEAADKALNSDQRNDMPSA